MVVKVYLDEELEERFRRAAMEVYGYGRGSLSSAAEDAIRSWLQEYDSLKEEASVPEDPVGAIRGLLSHVDKGAVELQHEAGEIRVEG
ncbi:MAG: hypothetical protein ACLFVP_07040 [Candidatus Bathyarchaeia archaeon]